MSQALDEILETARDHHLAGRFPTAIDLYRKALELAPKDSEVFFLLGLALFQAGHASQAAEEVRRAISLDPNVAEYHCDLARILFTLNDCSGAIAASRKALELQPSSPEALFNLGNALCRTRQFQEGIDAYQTLLAQQPAARDAANNLGMALLELGRIDDAIASFDQILASNPFDAAAHSNRIYAMHFNPSCSAAQIRRELIDWNDRHALPAPVPRSFPIPAGPDRVPILSASAMFRPTFASTSSAGISCHFCPSMIKNDFISPATPPWTAPTP